MSPGRERLDVSLSAADRLREARCTRDAALGREGNHLEGADTAVRSLWHAGGLRQAAHRRSYGRDARVGVLCLGDWAGGEADSGGIEPTHAHSPAIGLCRGRSGATAGKHPSDALCPAMSIPAVSLGRPGTHKRRCGTQLADQSMITNVLQPSLLPYAAAMLPTVECGRCCAPRCLDGGHQSDASMRKGSRSEDLCAPTAGCASAQ